MNENTKRILDDLRKAGIDTTTIENQLKVSPILDKQADHIIGGGILRQQEYTRYMNQVSEEKKKLDQQVRELATLHDASQTTQLPQAALDTMKKMEEALIATGEYDEESVKQVSYIGQRALKDMVQKQPEKPVVEQIQDRMTNPNFNAQLDATRYVDVDTLQAQLNNMAVGGVTTNLEINAAMEELKDLGIKIDRAKVRQFQNNLISGFQVGKNLDTILDETFEVSKAKQAKLDADIENRIKEAAEKARAEALKEAGVPSTKKFKFGRHPILDRKRDSERNVSVQQTNGNTDGKAPENLNLNKELPTNKYGDVEIYKLRRGREERLQNAVDLNDKVMEHYANDITFTE